MAFTSLYLAALAASAPAAEALPPKAPMVVQDEKPTDDDWHGFLEASASYTDGNSDNRSVRVAGEAVRRHEDDRYTLRANVNQASNDGRQTEFKGGIDGKWDHFIDERLYGNVVAGAGFDAEANLDLRTYVGAGLGYQFYDDEKLRLSGEAGLVYFVEDFQGSPKDDYIAARLAYDLDYQVSETTLFEQNTQVFPSLEDLSDFYGTVDSKLSFQIKANWSAFIQHVLDYDNTPGGDAERIDNRVAVGIRMSY